MSWYSMNLIELSLIEHLEILGCKIHYVGCGAFHFSQFGDVNSLNKETKLCTVFLAALC